MIPLCALGSGRICGDRKRVYAEICTDESECILALTHPGGVEGFEEAVALPANILRVECLVVGVELIFGDAAEFALLWFCDVTEFALLWFCAGVVALAPGDVGVDANLEVVAELMLMWLCTGVGGLALELLEILPLLICDDAAPDNISLPNEALLGLLMSVFSYCDVFVTGVLVRSLSSPEVISILEVFGSGDKAASNRDKDTGRRLAWACPSLGDGTDDEDTRDVCCCDNCCARSALLLICLIGTDHVFRCVSRSCVCVSKILPPRVRPSTYMLSMLLLLIVAVAL